MLGPDAGDEESGPGPGFRLKARKDDSYSLAAAAHHEVLNLGAGSFFTCSGFTFDLEAMARPRPRNAQDLMPGVPGCVQPGKPPSDTRR